MIVTEDANFFTNNRICSGMEPKLGTVFSSCGRDITVRKKHKTLNVRFSV